MLQTLRSRVVSDFWSLLDNLSFAYDNPTFNFLAMYLYYFDWRLKVNKIQCLTSEIITKNTCCLNKTTSEYKNRHSFTNFWNCQNKNKRNTPLAIPDK